MRAFNNDKRNERSSLKLLNILKCVFVFFSLVMNY